MLKSRSILGQHRLVVESVVLTYQSAAVDTTTGLFDGLVLPRSARSGVACFILLAPEVSALAMMSELAMSTRMAFPLAHWHHCSLVLTRGGSCSTFSAGSSQLIKAQVRIDLQRRQATLCHISSHLGTVEVQLSTTPALPCWLLRDVSKASEGLPAHQVDTGGSNDRKRCGRIMRICRRAEPICCMTHQRVFRNGCLEEHDRLQLERTLLGQWRDVTRCLHTSLSQTHTNREINVRSDDGRNALVALILPTTLG